MWLGAGATEHATAATEHERSLDSSVAHVARSRGQRCGDIELPAYLPKAADGAFGAGPPHCT